MNIDFGNILRGAGIFACIGGILLIALIALAVRSFSSRRNSASQTSTGQRPQSWETPGRERPHYDDDRIQSSGGFGGPATGRSSNPDDRISREPRPINRQAPRPSSNSEGDLDDRLRRQQREQDDDNNVQSRGGFGG